MIRPSRVVMRIGSRHARADGQPQDSQQRCGHRSIIRCASWARVANSSSAKRHGPVRRMVTPCAGSRPRDRPCHGWRRSPPLRAAAPYSPHRLNKHDAPPLLRAAGTPAISSRHEKKAGRQPVCLERLGERHHCRFDMRRRRLSAPDPFQRGRNGRQDTAEAGVRRK